MQDKTKLKYRLNGMSVHDVVTSKILFLIFIIFLAGFVALVISLVTFAGCLYFKLPVAKLIHKKFLSLITHALILSCLMSVLLFIKSFVEKTGVSPHGNTGAV